MHEFLKMVLILSGIIILSASFLGTGAQLKMKKNKNKPAKEQFFLVFIYTVNFLYKIVIFKG